MPVDLELFQNSIDSQGTGTLASDPGSGGTTWTLTSGHGARFPAVAAGQRLRLQCETEIVVVTAHTAGADTFTVLRGQEGTTAAAHAASAAVNAVLTADAQRRWMPDYVWQPRQQKLLLSNFDPNFASIDTPTGTTLVPYLYKVFVPEPMTLANVVMVVHTAGATLTAGSNECGVYNSSGTLIGRTATQATAWTSTGVKTMALTAIAGQSLTVAGGPGVFVWLAYLSAGTTRPGVGRMASTSLLGAAANAGLTAADGWRIGTLAAVVSGTGLPLTFLPGTNLSMNGINNWIAAS